MHSKPHITIVGCGYVGRRLAAQLLPRFDVTAIVRRRESAQELQGRGIATHVIDLDRVRSGSWLPERLDQEAIIYLAPPPPTGESDLRLSRFLELATVPPKTFIYMSTTGVYGDAQGQRVDESTPANPQTERARRRLTAEEMTRVWCTERHVRRVVLRVPGIYGPARLPLDRLHAREPAIYEEQSGISNRIHVDDLVTACMTALLNPEARGVYNVTDGSTMSTTRFLNLVADLAALPRPPCVSMEEAQLTFPPSRLSYLNESREVSNERMLKHLGVKLRFADVEHGIRASLQDAG